MIKPHHFATLALATAASVLLAIGLYVSSNRWSAGKLEGTAVMPDLSRQMASVGAIEIAQGEKKVTLERAGELWKIKERAGYPANQERVRALLSQLSQALLIEPRTASVERHKLLELEDTTGKDAKSRAVRILNQKGQPISEIVLGKSRLEAFGSGKGGIYVRRPKEAQTWFASGDPKAPAEPKDWMTVAVFETESAKIAKLVLEHPGEEPLVIEKGDGKEQKFKLAKMPDGQKLKQGVTIDQIAQGFASIELDDVRKLDATPAGNAVSVFKLTSETGLGVTFRLRKDGDAHWLSLTAAGDGDAKKTSDDINAKATGWEYKLPQWKLDQINKRRADLFETS